MEVQFGIFFPTDPKISWEGHLSGFIVGILLALLFKKNTPINKVYKWQMGHFC